MYLQIILLHSYVSSIPPAETVTDDYPSPENKWWVKELCLHETEKSTIDKGEKLSDVHIQAVKKKSSVNSFLTYQRCYQQYLFRKYTKGIGPRVDIFRFTSLKITG